VGHLTRVNRVQRADYSVQLEQDNGRVRESDAMHPTKLERERLMDAPVS
jgi:hypothetical protein